MEKNDVLSGGAIVSVDQLKLAYSILKELSKGNKPAAKDYGITNPEYASILMDLQNNKGYLENVSVSYYSEGYTPIYLDSARVTLSGLEFLHDHSKLKETYKGLKEVRDWISAFIP